MLAIFIWVQSLLVSEHRSVVNLPVNLKSVPKNLTLQRLPQSIPFNVRGKGMEILKLRLSKTRVSIDASKIKPGVDIIALTDYTIDLPENVEVTLIGPVEKQEIAIHADVFHQKKVAVRLAFADNYTRQRFSSLNYHLIPERLTIFGPKNKVLSVDHLLTEAISREQLSEREFLLKLSPLPEELSSSETEVMVKVSSSFNSSKVFENIPISGAADKNYFPSRVTIKVSGDSELLNSLNPAKIVISTSAEADASGLFALKASLPEGIEFIAITPDKVRQRK